MQHQRPLTSMGKRIHAGMVAVGIVSAAALARDAQISNQTVHRWLYDHLELVDASTLFRISDRLNLSSRWLLNGDANPNKPERVDPTESLLLKRYRKLSDPLQERLIYCANDLAKVG